MTIEEFQRAIKNDDLVVGNSFWIHDIEFKVLNKR